MARFDKYMAELYSNLPTSALLIVLAPSGDISPVTKELQEKANSGVVWNEEKEAHLENVIREFRKGITFFGIKPGDPE